MKQKLCENILKSLEIESSNFSETKSLFENVRTNVEKHVNNELKKIDFSKPIIEGESKKFYNLGKVALVELKPTMYSFTFNRYGVVKGTDNIRLSFWNLFGSMLNTRISDSLFSEGYVSKHNALIKNLFDRNILKAEYPFVSNYLGEVLVNEKRYAVVKFVDGIPPLEVVWKDYLVGTMKHNLKKVDKYNSKVGEVINYEAKLPRDIIRFDWRNPLPDKDECIPDEFANFYVDVDSAREVSRLASYLLDEFLQGAGYKLVDLCYFINYEGNMIFSEITPDGMRIRNSNGSFDKDLWRAGKDEATINSVWTELYLALGGKK